MNARADVISETYRTMQQKLHENPDYGITSIHFAPMIKRLISRQLIFKSNPFWD